MSEVSTKQLLDEIIKNRSEIKTAIEACEARLLLKVEEERTRINQLEKENSSLKGEIEILKTTSRKNNIIIFGLKHQVGDISIGFITKKIEDLLEIVLYDTDVNDLYVLGNSEDSPIKLELTSYLKKKVILENCHKLKGKHISIRQDLTIKQRDDHRLLRKHLYVAKKNKENTCYIKNNVLHINEETYTVEELLELEKVEATTPTLLGNLTASNTSGITKIDTPKISSEPSNKIADRTRRRGAK